MTLNTSGSISLGGNTLGQSIEEEFYGTVSNQIDIKTAANKAGVPNAITNISFNQFHGVSAVLSLSPNSETIPYAITYANYNPILTFTTNSKTTAYPPYTYVISSGSLPTGMTLSSAGVLSGTPTVAGTYNFNITSTDSKTPTAQSCIAVYTLNVTYVAPFTLSTKNTYYLGYTYGSTTSTQFSANQTSNSTSITPITVSGGTTPYTFSSTTSTVFPSLLTLNSSTGVITITGGSTAVTNFSTAKTLNLSFTDSTTSPYTYNVTTSTLTIQAVQYITATPASVVMLYATPSSTTTNYPANTFSAGGTTTVAATAGVSSFTAVSGGIGALLYTITPALPTGLTYNTANGLITATSAIALTSLTGTQTYNVVISNPTTTFNYTTSFTLQAVSQLNTVVNYLVMYIIYSFGATTSTLFSKNQTTSFTSYNPVTITGGTTPYNFTSTNLPTGLTLNSTTGSITITGGTATVANFVSPAGFNISMADSTPGALTYTNASFVIRAVQAVTATPNNMLLVYTSGATTTTTFYGGGTSTVAGTTGVKSFLSVSGGYGTLSYSITPALPTGMVFNTTSGLVTANTTVTVSALSSAQTYTVNITDSASGFILATSFQLQAVQIFGVTIKTPIYAVYNSGSTTLIGFSTNQTTITSTATPLTVTGGTTPYTFTSTNLPNQFSITSSTGALTINSGAVNTGITTNTGYNMTVTDSTTATNMSYTNTALYIQAVQLLTLTTKNVILVYTYGNTTTTTFWFNNAATTGNQSLVANVSGGLGTYSYTISPALPSGLTLLAGATLSITTVTITSLVSPGITYNLTVTDSTTTFSYTTGVNIQAVAAMTTTTQTIYLLYAYNAVNSTSFVNNQASANPITISHGTPPYTYASSNMPTGLSLNSSTGAVTLTTGSVPVSNFTSLISFAISATDSTPGQFPFTLAATTCHVQAVQAINITPHNIIMLYTPPATTSSLFSTGGNSTVTGSTGVYPATSVTGGLGTLTYAISPALGTGLQFNTITGLLSMSGGVTVSTYSSPVSYNLTITDPTTSINLVQPFTIQAVPQLTTVVSTIYVIYSYGSATATIFSNGQTSFNPVVPSYGTSPYTYTSTSLPSVFLLNSSTGAITLAGGSQTVSAISGSGSIFYMNVTDSTSTPLAVNNNVVHYSAIQAIQATPVNIIMTYTGTTTSTFFNGTNAFTGVSGGAGTLNYTVSAGTPLPSGLSMSATGVLSTTGVTVSGLTTAQTYNVTITDSTSGISLATSFTVRAVPLMTVTTNNPYAFLYLVYPYGTTSATSFAPNQSTVTPVTGSGGTPPLIYSLNTTLSTNISIDSSTGALSVTTPVPIAGFLQTPYSITVKDSSSTQQSYTTPNYYFNNVVQAIHATPVNIVMYYTGTTTSTFAGSGGTQILGSTGVRPFGPAASVTGGFGTLGYTATNLPAGLSLSSTGLLTSSGITSSLITTQQAYNVTITDPTTTLYLSTSFNLVAVPQLVVTPKNIYITYNSGATTATTFANSATSAYPFTVTGGSGTLTYSSTTLPSAFTLNTSTGAITINGGSVAIAPYTSGVTFTLKVTDQTVSPYTQSYSNSTITIQAVQTLIATNNIPSTYAAYNLANNVSLTNLAGIVPTYTGGLAPITYSSTALSAVFTSLTFSAGSGGTATISGTPNTESAWTAKTSTQTGYYTPTNFSFTITDVVGQTATATSPIFISVKPSQTTQTNGGSGPWAVPTSVTNISAVAIGGGGGGGGGAYAMHASNWAASVTTGSGGGGGGLSYISNFSIPLSVTSFTVTAGAGGSAGADKYSGINAFASNGTAGGTSTLSYCSTTVISASGGGAGTASTAIAGTGITVTVTGGGSGGGSGGGGSGGTSFSGGSGGASHTNSLGTAACTTIAIGAGGGGGAAGYNGSGGNGAQATCGALTQFKTTGYPYTIYISHVGSAGSSTCGVGAGAGGGGSSTGSAGSAGSTGQFNQGGNGGNMTLQPYSTSVSGTAGAAGPVSTYTSSSNSNYPGGNGGTINGQGGGTYGGGGGGRQGGTGGAVRIIWGTQSAAVTANGTLIPPQVIVTRQYPYTNVQDY